MNEKWRPIMAKVGFILLAILLILMSFSWLGATIIPAIALGILGLITAVFIIVGQLT